MSKVLLFSVDSVPSEKELAGGFGVRYWEFARGLCEYGHDVALAVPKESFRGRGHQTEGLSIVPWNLNNIKKLSEQNECVILPHVHSHLSERYANEVNPNIPTVIDLYDPVLIENLSLQKPNQEGVRIFINYLSGIVPLLKRGDFFVCANERQRYYYLGVLNVLGRINPLTYHENLLDIVPQGVSDKKPTSTKPVLKGKVIGSDDLAVLWFSGIYPWYDAVTLVKAMKEVVAEVPKAKMAIVGGIHPQLRAPSDEYDKTINEAKQLDLLNKHIFLADWGTYADRANWYLESDVAVCTYKSGLETLLAHRTRIIDLLWGGLPVITSEGDEVGTMIKQYRCGETVPVGDVKTLAATIIRLLKDEPTRREMSARASKLAQELTWKEIIKPLDSFCRKPTLAKDRQDEHSLSTLNTIGTFKEHKKPGTDKKQDKLSGKVEPHGLTSMAPPHASSGRNPSDLQSAEADLRLAEAEAYPTSPSGLRPPWADCAFHPP